MENNEVVQLYLDDIIPNRFQPREVFNDQALKELAISIREHGVIQPIIVRKFGEKYEIIAGERRYKASTMAGLTRIPAIIKNLDDKESSKVALIENLQRRDLTPIEEARTYQKILDLDEMTQEDLAKTMGKSQSAVSNKLRLLSLPDEIQEALLKEEISERHARSLLNVNDKNIQVGLLKEIINNKMTVRELDLKIKQISSNQEPSGDNETSGGSTVVFEEKKDDGLLENNNSVVNNSLFDNVDTKVIETENLFTNEEIKSNSGLSSLFNNSSNLFKPIEEPVDNNSNNNLFSDPTKVDINKIREESSDINSVVEEKEVTDIKSLLKPQGVANEDNNRFIGSFETVEQTNNNDLGNSSLFKDNSNSLFNSPVVENKDISSNSLFGSNTNQNINNNELTISVNNVQNAVNDVRNVIKSYQEKGYTVSVEELDLDREVQLIVKFNKN